MLAIVWHGYCSIPVLEADSCVVPVTEQTENVAVHV